MKCPNCDFESPEGTKFCAKCGASLAAVKSAPAPTGASAPIGASAHTGASAPVNVPLTSTPITPSPAAAPSPASVPASAPASASAPAFAAAPVRTAPPAPNYTAPAANPGEGVAGFWAFFGMMFLFAIPVIGWIACIVCCFAPENKSLKNFARAQIAWKIIATVISVITIISVIAFAGRLVEQVNKSDVFNSNGYSYSIPEDFDKEDIDKILDFVEDYLR